MAQQKTIIHCINSDCNQELQVKVKYCPFCGTEYIGNITENKPPQVILATNQLQIQQDAEKLAIKELELKKKQEAEKKFQAEQELIRKATEKAAADAAKNAKKAEETLEKLKEQQTKLAEEKAAIEREKAKQNENHAIPPFQPVQSKENSTGKIILIIVVVIIAFVIFASISDDQPATEAEQTVEPNQSCEMVITEINQFLQENKPSRALTVIQMYQNDCKHENQFIQASTSTQLLINTANSKLTLAKEYMQVNNLDMAETTVQSALAIDNELVGAAELLQQIADLKMQSQEQQTEAESSDTMDNVPATVTSDTNQSITEQSRQNEQAQEAINQNTAYYEAQQRRQKELAAEKARQAALEQQKNDMARQAEQKYSSALVSADKALRTKNYGSAKRIAKEVLNSSPNNSQALRILRQAEEGEAKAFDEMIIE